jgi:methionyl-tRNA formyltransferase
MPLRIALFGQAPFGRDTLVRLLEAGHDVVGVYTPPAGARPDPLAAEAEARGLRLLRHARFRSKGAAIPGLVAEHRALRADLNVLAFVTVILPPEIVDAPPRGSLCFHPSLLPRFRGGNALAWQILMGAREAGVTVFRPDAGVDTGPIVVQKGPVPIADSDTAATLYFEKLYPLGLDAIVEAVAAVDAGSARETPQDESQASHQGLVTDEVARLDFAKDAATLDRWIRGCDPQPGAWALCEGRSVRLFDCRLAPGDSGQPPGSVLAVESGRAWIAARGGRLSVGRAREADGAKKPAARRGRARAGRRRAPRRRGPRTARGARARGLRRARAAVLALRGAAARSALGLADRQRWPRALVGDRHGRCARGDRSGGLPYQRGARRRGGVAPRSRAARCRGLRP